MGKKILLADDSITIQKVIELTFSDEDFEVVTVGNGRLAIEKVQDVRPDLVLCDIIMPEKDGYEVCDFIKKHPALSRTPVLLLTGAFEPFDQERAARVGCDGFLAKPFEPQTLIAKVKDLLSRAAAAPAPASPVWTAGVPLSSPGPPRPAPEPETFVFVPEPPPAYQPSAPPPMPFEEAGVTFFSDEPLAEESPTARASAPSRSGDTVPVPSFPEAPDFEQYRASAFDEVAPAPAPVAAAASKPAGFPPVDEDEGPETLLPVSSEEAATLRGAPGMPAAPDPTPPRPARAPIWTQQTVEVPLEARARAAMEAVQVESGPALEELFREPASAGASSSGAGRGAGPAHGPAPAAASREPEPTAARPASRPEAAPRATPAPPVISAAVPPPGSTASPTSVPSSTSSAATPAMPGGRVGGPAGATHEDPSTLSVSAPGPGTGRYSVPSAAASPVPTPPASAAPASAGPAANSGQAANPPAGAAGMSVPVEMVSQIAQRVVAQISEKIIREVAWEVIPDLAETLLKKEIERLKAELQQK